MKKITKITSNFLAIILSVVLCLSTTVVLAAETEPVYGVEDITAVLEKINTEYGTNMHVLSDSELAELGLTATESQPITASELKELEEHMRYIAEVQIPQFERETQEAIAIMESLGIDSNTVASALNEERQLGISAGPVYATKAINYATVGASTYISTDDYGNTVWGSILAGYCDTNMYQSIWFLAPFPAVTHIDARRSLYWTGEGDYYAYYNGTQVYLYSGTQYASRCACL